MKVDKYFLKRKKEFEGKLWEEIEAERDYTKLEYALSSGKRLRSCLTLLVFEACEGKDYGRAMEAALAGELMHSASLVLDDILDSDLMRRGKASVYMQYGVGDAALLSHRMVSLGFKIIMSHDLEVIRTFIETWDLTLNGERMDIELSKEDLDQLIPEGRELYFDVVSKKSASLFAGSCKIGAQEAKAPKELQKLFWKYGNLVGLVYQLADDYAEMKKGKFEVLPLVFLLETGAIEDEVQRMLERFAEDTREERSQKIFGKLGENYEMLFQSEMERIISEAKTLVKNSRIPNSSFKSLLSEVPKYVVSRLSTGLGETRILEA